MLRHQNLKVKNEEGYNNCYQQEYLSLIQITKINIIIYEMRINLERYATLVGFCFCTFTNALGFGRLTSNLQTFGLYYNCTIQNINESFYIGLILEILFCIPAMKIIEWRFDYSIYCCAFFSLAGYWIQYLSTESYSGIFLPILFNSLGQIFALPIPVYLADRWFHLEKRSIVIGFCIYANLSGYACSAIITSIYVGTDSNKVQIQALVYVIFGSVNFLVCLLLIKNKPKVEIQKQQKITLKHLKYLWRHKFDFYGIVMESVFLGVSWSYLAGAWVLEIYLQPYQIGIITLAWIFSGMTFGVVMSFAVNLWISKTGNFFYYDVACKFICVIGTLSYTSLGLCYQFQINSFFPYLILSIFLGIGSLGYYGMVFLSLVETMHPLPSLIVGTIITAGASIYSAFATLIGTYTALNFFYSMALTTVLPLIYVCLVYQTEFKRYKYYLNEQKAKFEFFKVQRRSSTKQQ